MPTKGVLIGPNLHKRQMRLLRWGEDRMGTDKRHRRRTPEILGLQIVEFELLENYVKWSTVPVQAARRTWSSTANDGNGGFVSDCEDIIYVCDFNGEGFEADIGGMGKCYMKRRKNEPHQVGVMVNLCCKGDEIGECGA